VGAQSSQVALLKTETTVLQLGWVFGGFLASIYDCAMCILFDLEQVTLPPLQLLDLKMDPAAFCA